MMLTLSDAIKELSLKSESELTLDYPEDLTKGGFRQSNYFFHYSLSNKFV